MIKTQSDITLPARLTIPRAAQYLYLDISEKSICRYIAQGRLKAFRIGPRMIRVDRESLLALGRPVGGVA